MANISRVSDPRFQEKVTNFPRNLYKIDDRNSKIFKLMYTLLEVGVGQMKGMQDLANQSQNSLAGTEGIELDEFFQMFGIKRDPKLIYNGNLLNNNNTIETFQEFKSLDAKFRVAIAKMLQAIQKGGTPDGLRLMAEATTSYRVQIIEPWQHLTEYSRLSSLNEVVILILPDEEIDDDEISEIKTRVTNNIEMIRPAGSLITVEVINPDGSQSNGLIESEYASAGSFMFLSDGNNQYVELLSQEREIELNSFVIDANSFTTDTQYSTVIGELQTDGDLDYSLIVKETVTPPTPIFFVLLSDGENSEIVLAYNRTPYQEGDITFFLYEVNRAQLGTTQVNWNNSEQSIHLLTNLTRTSNAAMSEEQVFDQWIPIPDSDSPDNYPGGKFRGDSNKYDANGNYLFEWSSQEEYNDWFSKGIKEVGGEVYENSYRMPRVVKVSNTGETLIFALGPSYKIIRPIIMPKSNE